MDSRRLHILCSGAFLCALSFVAMSIQIPFPAAPHYKFDLADVPALIGTFTLGPFPALAIVIGRNILHALIISPTPTGHLMNLLSSGSLVLAAGFLYKRIHTKTGAIWSLIFGVTSSTLLMIPANILVLPYYLGLAHIKVVTMTFALTIPFNLAKGVITSIATYMLYKSVSPRLPHYAVAADGEDTEFTISGGSR